MKLREKFKRSCDPLQQAIEACIKGKDPQESFSIRFINKYIGSGTFAERQFYKGDFLLEYSGELISVKEGEYREETYPADQGSFLFFFEHQNTKKCVDATKTEGTYGRMVNDGVKLANCKIKVVVVHGRPRLCLFASKDINKNQELRFDYGVTGLPWRKQGWEDGTDVEDISQRIAILPSKAAQQDQLSKEQPQQSTEDEEEEEEEVEEEEVEKEEEEQEEEVAGSDDEDEVVKKPKKRKASTEPSKIQGDEYVPDSCGSDSEEEDGRMDFKISAKKRKIRNYPHLMHTEQRTLDENLGRYKKPARKCQFCGKYYQEKLTRHIKTLHKDEKAVIEAMKLPKKEGDAAFDRMRKEGILLANKEQIKSGTTPMFQRERKAGNDDPLVICAVCKGFFSKRFFSRHKIRCQGDSCLEACPVPVSLLVPQSDTQMNLTEFKKEVLCKFRNDDVGEICRSDPTIGAIGKRLWDKGKAKENKKTEVRKSVMSDMRRLGSLYKCFKEQSKIHSTCGIEGEDTSRDMFNRKNFNVLIEAINSYTSNEAMTSVKSGLKLGLYYLLKKSSKVIKATHLIDEQDSDADEIDRFVSILELNYNFVFGDAMYQININRQKNLRKPSALPLEEDIQILRKYTLDTMASMVTEQYAVWDSHRFSKLRNLTVSRLTLFNARRGGEPCRISLEEWQQARSDAWIDQRMASVVTDEMEKHLLAKLKVTYQAGKGNNHLVPILFPEDCIPAMELLTCKEIRATAGIKEENHYVFACTQTSSNHVSGWHALNGICNDAGVSNKCNLTATKNRHRISTLYASFEIPEKDRCLFFKHMGHSAEINENIYQAPAAVMEVIRVGKQLQQIDNNRHIDLTDKPPVYEEPMSSAEEELEGHDKELEKDESKEDTEKENQVPMTSTRRPYTKWTKKDTTVVKKYFEDFITGRSSKTIPGRADVEIFLAKGRLLTNRNWKTIRTKVMNERVKCLQKKSIE